MGELADLVCIIKVSTDVKLGDVDKNVFKVSLISSSIIIIIF